MERPIHPISVLIGFLFGVSLSLLVLRLAGIVDNTVSIYGQLALLPALGLYIAMQVRQFKAAAISKNRGEGTVDS